MSFASRLIEQTADAFMHRHHMHPEALNAPELVSAAREEIRRGLAGERSSLGMFPAYLRGDAIPREDEPVLVIDAGGTNLRAARMRSLGGKLLCEEIRRTRMPGTSGEIGVEEMFEAIAELVLPLSEGCERGAFCFSYPCDVLPDGDGIMVRLTKELNVRGLVGSRICAPLEAAMQRLGAKGERRWRLLNDTVCSMLGGKAQCGRAYDDYIGLILGTGTNTCAPFAAERITKSPEAVAMGGDVLVNLESGGFDRFPRGDGDLRLDAMSEDSGSQWEEKAVSGVYLPLLMDQLVLLIAEDGAMARESAERLLTMELEMPEINILCGEETADDPFAFLSGEDRAFLCAVTRLLLDRASKLTACILSAIVLERGRAAGERVCICADGTTIRKNPLLRPRTEQYLRTLLSPAGVSAEFFEVNDATLLGAAIAGLSE